MDTTNLSKKIWQKNDSNWYIKELEKIYNELIKNENKIYFKAPDYTITIPGQTITFDGRDLIVQDKDPNHNFYQAFRGELCWSLRKGNQCYIDRFNFRNFELMSFSEMQDDKCINYLYDLLLNGIEFKKIIKK